MTPHCYHFLTSLSKFRLPHMFITKKKAPFYFPLFFRSLALTVLVITLMQSFKSPSNKNISNTVNINSHITTKPIHKLKNQAHMNYSSMEPVLFAKLHNIQLSCLVFRVTTFFKFDSTKSALYTLLKCPQDLDENLTILYSKLVTCNNYDHKSMTQTNGIYLIQPY